MHIPDGLLDPGTCGISAATSLGVLAWSLRQAHSQRERWDSAHLGALAALLFSVQLVDVPIAGGTSGHLLGAGLAALLLGPWAATLVMSTVLFIQCLLFQDGGLTALGANVLNMAIVGVWAGWLAAKGLTRMQLDRLGAAQGFVAGWASMVAAAFMVALELAWAGAVPIRIAFPAMLGWHALIGIGEGVITMAVFPALRRQLAREPGRLQAAG
ncbi:MAG: energy-coupling factor ABC transporter permease [Bacillota bacterium]